MTMMRIRKFVAFILIVDKDVRSSCLWKKRAGNDILTVFLQIP